METYEEIESKAAEVLSRWAEIVEGRPWGVAQGKPRIYVNGWGKGTTVYFEFPDFPDGTDTLIGGAAMKVFIDDCGQHPNWYMSRRRQIMQDAGTLKRSLTLMILADVGDEDFARRTMHADYDEGALRDHLDEIAGHLINGRKGQAETILVGIREDDEEDD